MPHGLEFAITASKGGVRKIITSEGLLESNILLGFSDRAAVYSFCAIW